MNSWGNTRALNLGTTHDSLLSYLFVFFFLELNLCPLIFMFLCLLWRDKLDLSHLLFQEMMGLTYFMLDQSRKEAEYCMENAFNTYLVCISFSFLLFLRF